MTRAGRGLTIAAAVLGSVAALAGLAWIFAAVWAGEGVRLGFHGWLAMTIALVGATAVGGGLMWLAFYSARAGWDDLDRDNP